MAGARTPRPNDSARRTERPALATRRNCPTCGRGLAIVFRQIRAHDRSVKDVPLVCLGCCMAAGDRLWPAVQSQAG